MHTPGRTLCAGTLYTGQSVPFGSERMTEARETEGLIGGYDHKEKGGVECKGNVDR